MNNNMKVMCEELTKEIQASYEESVTIERAEKLAARFLHAQILLGTELMDIDLNARMKKSGVKAIRAALYLEEVTKYDKKPTEAALEAKINTSDLVQGEQGDLDTFEVERDELQRLLSVFHEAHIFFRGISKGRFD